MATVTIRFSPAGLEQWAYYQVNRNMQSALLDEVHTMNLEASRSALVDQDAVPCAATAAHEITRPQNMPRAFAIGATVQFTSVLQAIDSSALAGCCFKSQACTAVCGHNPAGKTQLTSRVYKSPGLPGPMHSLNISKKIGKQMTLWGVESKRGQLPASIIVSR